MTTSPKSSVAPSLEALAPTFEKQIDLAKKSQQAYLKAYEKTVSTLTDTYESAAKATNVPWIDEMASSQIDLTRELTKTYVSAAREQVA